MNISIYDRIAAGDYETKLPHKRYPVPPTSRIEYNKPASAFSHQQLLTLVDELAAYERDVAAADAVNAKASADQAILVGQFYLDLTAECLVPGDHPFIVRLYALAWDSGHAGGLQDIASCFTAMLPLWGEALRLGMAGNVKEETCVQT